MSVELWLQIGTIGMAIGTLLLFFPMLKSRAAHEQEDSILHFMVPLVALTLYLLMTLGFGSLTLPSGRVFYYGRYVDWCITTPLLLLGLVNASVGNRKKPIALIAGLLGADVYMIATGFVAAFTDNPTLKWSFYTLSCLAFLALYAMLWGPFRKLSEGSALGEDYRKKNTALSVLWFAYPFVFLLGQEGLRLWSPGVDALCFTVLDVTAKVAYGLWAVSLASQSAGAKGEYPEGGLAAQR